MCGRYTLTKPPVEVRQAGIPFEPRYNIAPTQPGLVVRRPADGGPGDCEVAKLRWGLIPSWAKDPATGPPLINARSETAADKPAFRTAFRRRRCLAPADGFYEWKRRRAGSQPYYFQLADEAVFYMAALWEAWRGPGGERLESYAILTTPPNRLVARCHDRMPALLFGEKAGLWLDGGADLDSPEGRYRFFAPVEEGLMASRPVSVRVNSNQAEGPDCLLPPEEAPAEQLDLRF